jgi:hypothetical protein
MVMAGMAGNTSPCMTCYPFTGFQSNQSGLFVERTSQVIPPEFMTFFAASLTADGALIGLLFVAIAIEPERTFGKAAAQERELAASGAFTSLVNAFLVSMIALIPDINIGWGVICVAGLSLINIIIHAADKLRRGQRTFTRSLVYTISALLLYGLEIFYSVQLILRPHNLDAVYTLIIVLVVTYAVALTRAWTLLSGENRSLRATLIDAIKGRSSRAPETAPAESAVSGEPQEKPVPPV